MAKAGLVVTIEDEDGAGPSSLTQLDLFHCGDSHDPIDDALIRGGYADKKPMIPLLSSEPPSIEGRDIFGEIVHFLPRLPSGTAVEDSRAHQGRLATPFYQLLSQIDAEREKGKSNGSAGRERAKSNASERDASKKNTLSNHATSSSHSGELWVEKYKPRKFTDLLAVDRANVDILQWVSQWSRCIQGSTAKIGNAGNANMSKRRRMTEAPETPMEDAIPSGWPEKKILLIHGPPGLGKTTLVQVLASTAGFELVEINASDERSGDAVLKKVEAAVTSNSLLNGRRPNLLMIDEIDGVLGAGGGNSEKSLVLHLLKLAASSSDPVAPEAESAAGKKSRAKQIRVLKRPIICICNDPYVPVLKPLRQVAQVISLKKPAPSVLARRLGEICSAERVQVEGKALLELAESMDCDIRASLHALQFIAKQRISLTGNKLAQALSGLKDVQRTTAKVYEAIFHKDPRERRSHSLSVLSTIADHDDYSTLAMGVFELYPQSKFYDDTHLSKVREGLECLGWVDIWESFGPDSPLSAYSPFALLQTHRLFASPAPLNQKFPQEDYRRHLECIAFEQILNAYARELPPLSRDSKRDLCLSRIPCILPLIRSQFRIANPQLLKAEERSKLRGLVELMISEGLSYRQTRRPDGQYDFLLEPPIDALAKMSRKPPGLEDDLELEGNLMTRPISQHENAIRQMIAREIESERIRRIEARRNLPAIPSTVEHGRVGRSAMLMQAYADISSPGGKRRPDSRVAGTLQDKPTTMKKDFFGRPIVDKPQGGKSSAINIDMAVARIQIADQQPPTASTRPKVWYKYNEGFTNAIKRPLKVKDLFKGPR